MSLRPPQTTFGLGSYKSGDSVLEYELLEEKAATLKLLGRRLRASLDRLSAVAPEDTARREAVADEASETAWEFMVQRELCGFRDWPVVVREYAIPREVLVRLGARRRARRAQEGGEG